MKSKEEMKAREEEFARLKERVECEERGRRELEEQTQRLVAERPGLCGEVEALGERLAGAEKENRLVASCGFCRDYICCLEVMGFWTFLRQIAIFRPCDRSNIDIMPL